MNDVMGGEHFRPVSVIAATSTQRLACFFKAHNEFDFITLKCTTFFIPHV